MLTFSPCSSIFTHTQIIPSLCALSSGSHTKKNKNCPTGLHNLGEESGHGCILHSWWPHMVWTSLTFQQCWRPNTGTSTGCKRVWNSFRIFFLSRFGIFFGFLGWYHLPSVCNGLELKFVILHGICHIWACSPSILHGIYYMWACSPSILYGICHILACSPSILHGISYMWACSPSILYGICHILACSPSILHGMFYMWACSPKYLQMRKLGIR